MSNWSFSKKIALRYLWSKRSEAFISIISIISVLGVAIGVMVLSIVMSVMTGFEATLKEKILGTESHITVYQIGGRVHDWQRVQSIINGVNGIKSVSPFTYNQVLLKGEGRSSGVLIRGILPDTASSAQLNDYLKGSSSLSDLFDPKPITVVGEDGLEREVKLPGLIVGRELASSLYVSRGQALSALSPQVTSSPFGLMPKFRRFAVVGVYSSGLVEYESSVAYVDLREAQKFFGMGDTVSGIEVRVNDVDAAPGIAKEILEKLGGLGAGYTASDWTSSNKALWDAIRLEKKVYFIVLLLIIVMASFSIITTLIMIVLEKRKDIARMYLRSCIRI